MSCKYKLYLAHEQSADSDPVIIPYMVINRRFTALYGIITGSLSAYYSCATCIPRFASLFFEHKIWN